jgi:hypothetical protein
MTIYQHPGGTGIDIHQRHESSILEGSQWSMDANAEILIQAWLKNTYLVRRVL